MKKPSRQVRDNEACFYDMAVKDRKVVDLLASLEDYPFDFEADKALLTSRHKTLYIRIVKVKTLVRANRGAIIKVEHDLASTRSDFIDKKMLYYGMQSRLEEHTKAIAYHLSVKYASYIQSEYSTKAERDGAIANVLTVVKQRIANYHTIIALIDMAVENIDKLSWSMTNVVKILSNNVTWEK